MKEWFTLGCRIFGMWQLLVAAGYVITAFNISAHLYTPNGPYTFGGMMVHTFAHFFLAAWLLKGAPKIADFFYPDAPEHKEADEKTDGSSTPTI